MLFDGPISFLTAALLLDVLDLPFQSLSVIRLRTYLVTQFGHEAVMANDASVILAINYSSFTFRGVRGPSYVCGLSGRR